jgi:hypothetical protein
VLISKIDNMSEEIKQLHVKLDQLTNQHLTTQSCSVMDYHKKVVEAGIGPIDKLLCTTVDRLIEINSALNDEKLAISLVITL